MKLGRNTVEMKARFESECFPHTSSSDPSLIISITDSVTTSVKSNPKN